MAQTNGNTGMNLTEEKQQFLAQLSATAYSIHGYLPVASEWRLTLDQLKDIIYRTTKDFLDDVDSVTVSVDHQRGRLEGYVWIPRNSKHITNNELKNANAAIKRAMTSYSPQIKEYMDKFCYKNQKRLISAEDSQVKGLVVNIQNFLKVEFDENGYEFGKSISSRYKQKTILELSPQFLEGSDNRYGKLLYITVRKQLRNQANDREHRPRKSYNVH